MGRFVFAVLFLFVEFSVAQASSSAPESFNFSGTLTDSGGTVVQDSVDLILQVYNPAGNCLLYQESVSVDTSTTGGRFSVDVGSAQGAAKRSGFDPNLAMTTVFKNSGSIAGASCTYTPSAGDERQLRVTITRIGATSMSEVFASHSIRSVPFAMVAESAQDLQGKTPSNFVQVNTSGTKVLTQANVENVFDNSNYTALLSLLAGSSSLYSKPASNGTTPLPNLASVSSPSMGQVWFDTGSNSIKYYDGTATQTVSASTGTPTNITATGTITGGTIVGTSGTITTFGARTIKLYDADSSNLVTLKSPTALAADYTLQLPADDGSANQVLTTDGSGVLSWTTPASSGVSSVTATAPVVSSGGSTPDISMAKATASVDGYLAASDFASFNNKLGTALASGKILVGSAGGVATAQSVSGDMTLSNAGVATLASNIAVGTLTADGVKVNNAGSLVTITSPIGANYNLSLPPDDGSANQVLTTDGAGVLTWSTPAATGVTSVTATAPLLSSGGSTPNLSIPKATTSVNGYLDSSDFTTFNNKLGTALTDGKIWIGNGGAATQAAPSGDLTMSNTGVFTLGSSGVGAGTYTQVTVDTKGRVTSATNPTTLAGYGITDAQSTSLASGKILVGSAGGIATALALAGDATLDNAGSLTLANTAVTPATYGSTSQIPTFDVDSKGRITSASNVSVTVPVDQITSGATKYFTYKPNNAPCANNDVLSWDNSNSRWICAAPAAGGSGLTSLNGQTGSSQSFGIGTAGLAPAFNSTGNVHTLNIPMASTGSVTAGLLSNSDYNIFNSKLGTGLANGKIWVGNSGTATPVSPSGDLTMDNAGSFTITSSGVTPSTYKSVTVNSKGLITAGTNPTTLAGYGITDAQPLIGYTTVNKAGDSMTGTLTVPTNGFTTSSNQFVLAANNVGIGTPTPGTKLEVNGTIRVGNGFETCGASYTGGIRYNGGNLEFCDGGSWAVLARAAAPPIVNNASPLTNGKIWIGSAGGLAVEQGMSGDVGITNTGTTTVGSVGGSTAAAVNTAAVSVGSATSSPTNNTLVKRDASGSAMFGNLSLTNGGTVTLTVPAATNYTLGLPSNVGSNTQALASTGLGGTFWEDVVTPVMNKTETSNANAALTTHSVTTIVSPTAPLSSGGDRTSANFSISAPGGNSFTLQNLLGLGASAFNQGTGSVISLTGFSSTAFQSGSSSSTGTLSGITASSAVSSGTVTKAIGMQSSSSIVGGTVVDQIGLYVTTNLASAPAALSNRYGIYLETPSGAGVPSTIDYGIYQAGNQKNVFNGVVMASSGVNIGGASATSAKLAIKGDVVQDIPSSTSTGTIDFSTGNTQLSSYNCAATMNLNNMKTGGSYTLVVTDPATTQCNFNIPSVTLKWLPANSARIASTHTIYNILIVGTTGYVSWSTGYQ